MVTFIALSAVVAIVIILTPRTTTVEGDTLQIKTAVLTYRYDLRHATAIESITPAEISGWQTIRLLGIGWPLQRVGWFRSPVLGTYLDLATDRSRMFLVQFPNRKLLVSPANGLEPTRN